MSAAKQPPVHALRREGRVVAATYCGVDPYRRGVVSDTLPGREVTCPRCVKERDRAAAAKATGSAK